jgi:hypothetical protein
MQSVHDRDSEAILCVHAKLHAASCKSAARNLSHTKTEDEEEPTSGLKAASRPAANDFKT